MAKIIIDDGKIEEGSKWYGTGDMRKHFIVIHEVEANGNIWVHYRDNFGDPPREYSCYKESFLQRFTRLPD